MLQELLYLGPEQRLRRLLSSICVENQYRATPATFRTQIEQYCRKCAKIKQPIRKGTESQNYFRTQIEQFEPI
jgi:hypothetical protein